MGSSGHSLEELRLLSGSSETGQVKAEGVSWEIHLFQNKGTETTRQRNVRSAYSPRCGLLGTRALVVPSRWAAGSGQGQRAPGILPHRGRDFGW